MSLFVEQTVFTIVTHFKFLVRDTKQELDLLPLHFLTLCTFTKQIILALHSNYNREMEERERKKSLDWEENGDLACLSKKLSKLLTIGKSETKKVFEQNRNNNIPFNG